jgi:hypothetical protein
VTAPEELSEEERELRQLDQEIAEAQAEAIRLENSKSVKLRTLAQQRAENDETKLYERLMAEHGAENIGRVKTRLGNVYLKRCDSDLYDVWQSNCRAAAKKGEEDVEFTRDLLRQCRLHPSAAEFDRILDRQPAALTAATVCVTQLFGAHATF